VPLLEWTRGAAFLKYVPPWRLAATAAKEERMRQTMLGALAMAGLVIAATAVRSFCEPASAATASLSPSAASGDLIAHVTAAEGGQQFVTVIDPRTRVMAVYHVDRTDGKITPKSVRNITWDLQMIEYNSGEPLPQDIRSGLQR
jgi:hypothetical protein